MKRCFYLLLVLAAGCHYAEKSESIALIQIQDRNGLTETVSHPDRLLTYEAVDFLSPQPYKKVLRVYKNNGKNSSRITTYHPNGLPCQYLEAVEMRANGMYREWFPNGQLKIEAHVIGGTGDLATGIQEDWIFEGESKVWDEKGYLVALIPYNKGFLEGKSLYYFPSGQIERELSFSKNSLEGESIEYWPVGTVKVKTTFKKGIKEGESSGFFVNERLAWFEQHSDGRLLKGSYYNQKGDVISEVVNGGGFVARVEDAELTLIEHRGGLPHGQVRQFKGKDEIVKAFHVKNGMKHGEEIEYYLSSELDNPSPTPVTKLSLVWSENRIHGCVKTWYKNGQIQSQREYCRNQRMGPSLAWYRDGSLMLYEEYEEDHLVTGQYYKMQKKEPVSNIANGNGIAILFDEEGSFLRKVTYLKGKAIDPEE